MSEVLPPSPALPAARGSATPTSARRRLCLLGGAAIALTVIVTLAQRGEAVSTRTFTADSAADFAAGVLDRVAVSSEGQVAIGVEVQRIGLEPATGSVWSILDTGDGAALVGTGVDGRVYRIDGGRATLYAETGAVVVTSLARGEDGTIYAATIPDGRIYRLLPPQNGRPQPPQQFAQLPDTEYVWSIAWDRTRHVLIAATGPNGKLFVVDRGGRASVVFDSEEPHLLSIALAADGTIYTGSGGAHAVLYAVRAPGQARTVARFPGDEVKSIVLVGNDVYVAANDFPEPPEPPRRSTSQSRVPTPGGTAGRPRPGRGALYHVRADGATERLYDSADAHINAIEWDAQRNSVLAALGANGRVVSVGLDRSSSIIVDVDEHQVLALAMTGRARLLGTGDSGAIYAVVSTRPAGATWTSRVYDATTQARWGAVRWRGSGALDWESRSGNNETPDATWSNWAALAADGTIQSPASRYVQLRARWSRDPSSVMRALTVYYLPINQRPVLTEVRAESKTGEPRPQAVHIAWKVENPDADQVRYHVRFRAEGEQTWRPVQRTGEFITGTSYDWSTEGLPEGYYRIEVEASDEASNPLGEGLSDRRTSEPVLVDNTPPEVNVTVIGGRVRGSATDRVSPVTRVEVAVDTMEWRSARAVDGVLDEVSEQYEADLPALADGGEHVVAVRAYDEAGNVGTASARFRAPVAPPAGAARPAAGRGTRR